MQIMTIEEAQRYIDAGNPTEWRDGGFYVFIKKQWVFVITPGSRLPNTPIEEDKPRTDNMKLFTIALLCALLGGGIGAVGSAVIAKNIIMNEKGIPGPQGPAGADGLNGTNGKDGLNGTNATVQNLNSIPGWPVNCANPTITPITITSGNTATIYPVLTCATPTSTTIPTTPPPTP